MLACAFFYLVKVFLPKELDESEALYMFYIRGISEDIETGLCVFCKYNILKVNLKKLAIKKIPGTNFSSFYPRT